MPFDYYRIFYFVAKYKSFSKAAKILHNNQPNITRCMNIMESELGCTLFIRSHRGIKLTPEGEQLYAHVAIAIQQISSGNDEFHKLYPHIKLKISNHSTPQAIKALRKGFVDFSIVTTPLYCEHPLQSQQLCSFRDILIGGPSYKDIGFSPKRLRDLQDFPFISLNEGTATRNFYEKYFYQNQLVFSPDMETATTNQILSLVQHDLGIGFCPETLAKDSIKRGEVVEISVKEHANPRDICLITDSTRPIGTAGKKLLEILMDSEV